MLFFSGGVAFSCPSCLQMKRKYEPFRVKGLVSRRRYYRAIGKTFVGESMVGEGS
jgi:hypothetical protein